MKLVSLILLVTIFIIQSMAGTSAGGEKFDRTPRMALIKMHDEFGIVRKILKGDVTEITCAKERGDISIVVRAEGLFRTITIPNGWQAAQANEGPNRIIITGTRLRSELSARYGTIVFNKLLFHARFRHREKEGENYVIQLSDTASEAVLSGSGRCKKLNRK